MLTGSRSRRFALASGLVVVGAVTAACAGDDAAPASETPGTDAGGDAAPDVPAGDPGAPIVFRPPSKGIPDLGDVPFPSDLFLGSSGRLTPPANGWEKLVGTNAAVLADALADLDGFARASSAIFFVDGEVDATTLPAEASAEGSVQLVDVDPASAQRGERYPVLARFMPSLGCISAVPQPGVVLPAGVRHAFVVTTAARDSKQRSLSADTELARIEALAKSERKTPSETLHGDALDELVAAGAVDTATDVAGLAVFTTSKMASEMVGLRQRLRDEEPAPQIVLEAAAAAPYTVAILGTTTTPNLDDWLGTPDLDENGDEWPGGDNPGGIAHDAIGAVASGAFVAPSYLDAAHHFVRDANGAYEITDATAMIPVTIIVPKAPAPASGYPVIVNGHGLSNHRGSMFGVADEFARAGFVTIGIDDVEHGLRGGLPDDINVFPGAFEGPDGIPDQLPFPVSFFAGFKDFIAVRDNFRQTVVDHTSLLRLIQNPALDLSPLAAARGGGAVELDGARVFYSGGSLGGIVGTMVTASEPEIHAAAFQVPGASFVQMIATESAKLHELVTGLAQSTFGIVGTEPVDAMHPVAGLLAQACEAGDPTAYAPHVLGAPLSADWAGARPSVLVTYTTDDEVLPNLATEALIRALGVPLVTPRLVEVADVPEVAAPLSGNFAGVTGGAVQYAPSTHALGYMRHDIREYLPGFPAADPMNRYPKLPASITIELPLREHLAQLVHFFETARDGTAEIIVTAPPHTDFDADGVLDADETKAGTDPFDPASK